MKINWYFGVLITFVTTVNALEVEGNRQDKEGCVKIEELSQSFSSPCLDVIPYNQIVINDDVPANVSLDNIEVKHNKKAKVFRFKETVDVRIFSDEQKYYTENWALADDVSWQSDEVKLSALQRSSVHARAILFKLGLIARLNPYFDKARRFIRILTNEIDDLEDEVEVLEDQLELVDAAEVAKRQDLKNQISYFLREIESREKSIKGYRGYLPAEYPKILSLKLKDEYMVLFTEQLNSHEAQIRELQLKKELELKKKLELEKVAAQCHLST